MINIMSNWKYIKIFVSSTFLDMDIERDALKNIVEPRLNEFLKSYACSLEFIDLRHSVKTTSTMSLIEREKQIFNICLEEIDNCKPYFMGIIGHRYGWIPSEDKVPCPKVYLPEDFPIEEHNLSVTMYEFLHGILSPEIPKERTIIFMRSNDSYKDLSKDDQSSYIESSPYLKYITEIRDYISSKKTEIRVVDYTLLINSYTDSDLLEWTNLIIENIKEVIKGELITETNGNKTYAITQENYIQEHIKNFCGRKKEINECLNSINDRLYITAKERGLGLSSFFCKIYDEVRQNSHNVCLIYCEDADRSIEKQDVITNWLLQMNEIDEREKKDKIIAIRDDIKEQIDLWKELVLSLRKKGYTIYRFCETISSNNYFDKCGLDIKNVVVITTIYYHEDMFFMRPMMYLISPLDDATISYLTKEFRREVKKAIIEEPCSSNAKWLKTAITIINKLFKFDFIQIRNRIENDYEERIINYQVNIVKELPNSIDGILLFYIERIKRIFSSNLIDNYLFLMSLNQQGWREECLFDIIDSDYLQVTTIRQMLGNLVLKQIEKNVWAFNDFETGELFSDKFNLKDCKMIINNAYKCVCNLTTQDPVFIQLIFKLAMLNGDITFCSDFIEKRGRQDSPLVKYARDSFFWYAAHYELDYISFISKLLSQEHTRTYNFYFNLLQWIKKMFNEETLNAYIASIERFVACIRNLWHKKEIDIKTYSVICDAIACKEGIFRQEGKYKEMMECLIYGLQISKEYYSTERLFLSYYHYFVLRINEYISRREKKDAYTFLKKEFILLESQNKFNYHSGEDVTTYASLLLESAKIMIQTGHPEQADSFCLKSIQVFLKFLDQQITSNVDTLLSPADTKRNLLLGLCSILKLHYHYGTISWNKLSILCESVLDKCHDCRLLKDKDSAYIYYHKAMAAYLFLQDCDDKEKILRLMDLVRNIEVDYDYRRECRGRTFFFDQQIVEKKKIGSRFIVWLYVNSLIMYIVSTSQSIDANDEFKLPNKITDANSITSNYMIFSFYPNLNSMLTYIGTKEFRKDGLPPQELWNSIIILFLSMIWDEISKGKGDLQYVIALYNSCTDMLNLYYSSVQMCVFEEELEEIRQIINASVTEELASTLNPKARFDGFIDIGDDYDIPWADDVNSRDSC